MRKRCKASSLENRSRPTSENYLPKTARQTQPSPQHSTTSIPEHADMRSVAPDSHGTGTQRNGLDSDGKLRALVVEVLSKSECHQTQPLPLRTLSEASLIGAFSLSTRTSNQPVPFWMLRRRNSGHLLRCPHLTLLRHANYLYDSAFPYRLSYDYLSHLDNFLASLKLS